MVILFKGSAWKTFMSSYEEWHSYIIGLSEVLCPWKPYHPMPLNYHSPLEEEYHYYLFGRAMGFLTLFGIVAGLALILHWC